MPTPDLKHCPFCGKAPAPVAVPAAWPLATDSRLFRVLCRCGASGPIAEGREAAGEAWGRRVGEVARA